uniref:Helicase_C_3 domain-containing protein n=1 Tax=Rodentolepis nana TaxID=102285 RepID=A0A0R3T5D2_RODNA
LSRIESPFHSVVVSLQKGKDFLFPSMPLKSYADLIQLVSPSGLRNYFLLTSAAEEVFQEGKNRKYI